MAKMRLLFILSQFNLNKKISPPAISIVNETEYDDDTIEIRINIKLITIIIFIFLLLNLLSIPMAKKNTPHKHA